MSNRLHRLGALILTIVTVFTLAGCQLAREDGDIQESRDQLIGVFVSFDHIELFDTNQYLMDHLHKSNGNMIVDRNDAEYNGRLYATLQDVEYKPVNAAPYTTKKYVFEGLEGSGLLTVRMPDDLSNSGYTIGTTGDEGFSDIKTHITSLEEEEGMEVEATLYVTPDAMEHALFINPVYQEEDGRVYLLSATGLGASGDMVEGSIYSQTLTDSSTITKNKESKTYRSSVKVSVETMFPIDRISLIQMDQKHHIVKEDSYDPGEIPQKLKAEDTTEYIMIETVKVAFSEDEKVERTIFTMEDENIWCLTNISDKLIGKASIYVDWGKED